METDRYLVLGTNREQQRLGMMLSIIIPVYNESAKVAKDIRAADRFLQDHDMEAEIIIVDDGSIDKSSTIAQKEAAVVKNHVRVMRTPQHRGKGYAVRQGMMHSRGSIVMFADSGLCTPFNMILNGLGVLQKPNCDIAHGSRKLPQSKILQPQPLLRRFISVVMRLIFRGLYRIPSLTDTQCGFKLYPGELARKLYGSSRLNGFLFDIEIILLAHKHGYRICEFPIEWKADLDSRLSPLSSLKGILGELLQLYKQQQNLK